MLIIALSPRSHLYYISAVTITVARTYVLLHVIGTPGRRFSYIARLPVPSPLFPSLYNNIYPTTYLTFVVLPRDRRGVRNSKVYIKRTNYNT